MCKKVIGLILALTLLAASAAASAELTNRDLQLSGGFAAVNSEDTFFFCAMESEGMPKTWGLYALSTCANGPVAEITEHTPARLLYANKSEVYYLAYTNDERSEHALYSLSLSGGSPDRVLDDIAAVFVDEDSKFLYVKVSDPYTLWRYDIVSEKNTKIKDMSKSEKTIYDACSYDGDIYFLAKDEYNLEYGYEYHSASGKATNLDAPNPQLVTGILYEGYRLYANDVARSRIYAVRLGSKKADQVSENKNAAFSLRNPRFGDFVYAYDGDANALICCPLAGGKDLSIKLDGDLVTRLILGGSKDELLFCYSGKVFSVKPDLSSMKALFDFPITTGGQVWNYVMPTNGDAVLMMGYTVDTFSYDDTLMPSSVYVISRSTGETIFNFPVPAEEGEPLPEDALAEPSAEGTAAPTDEETFFNF